MGTRGIAFRRILAAVYVAIGVPLAVVTCQGRGTILDETDSGTITAETGGAGSLGSTSQMGAGGAAPVTELTYGGASVTTGSGGGTPMTTDCSGGTPITTSSSTVIGLGGFNATTSGLDDAIGGAGRTFLGKYVEPTQSQGKFWVPTPPATATVAVPCEARQDVCAGAQSRDTWAQNVISSCMAETNSGGCVDFIFDKGTSCSKYVVYWHGATRDMGRCVATVDYYESCSGPDTGANVSVVRFGADCSPLY